MIKKEILLTGLLLVVFVTHAGVNGLRIGDKAPDFSLKDIDGDNVSLSDYRDVKGFIIVFTCNTCPYAKAYENRIIKLNDKYAPLGYPVIAINPNDPRLQPGDSYQAMKERATEKGFTYPYLVDVDQEVAKSYGAVRTPQVFLLTNDLTVAYIGAIDNNYKSDEESNTKYVENALQALMAGKPIEPNQTKARRYIEPLEINMFEF